MEARQQPCAFRMFHCISWHFLPLPSVPPPLPVPGFPALRYGDGTLFSVARRVFATVRFSSVPFPLVAAEKLHRRPSAVGNGWRWPFGIGRNNKSQAAYDDRRQQWLFRGTKASFSFLKWTFVGCCSGWFLLRVWVCIHFFRCRFFVLIKHLNARNWFFHCARDRAPPLPPEWKHFSWSICVFFCYVRWRTDGPVLICSSNWALFVWCSMVGTLTHWHIDIRF